MGNYISNSLVNLLELFTSHTHKPGALKGSADITQMVEHVVDVVDPRIRVIGRYAQKLSQPLAHTWDYLTEIANLIPGGVTINKANFSSDPRMKLIFENQSEIQRLLNTVNPLVDHHAIQNNQSSANIFMLLCMEKREHNFLGTELEGDILKRDVMQTSVTFSNRKFLSAGHNEEDAKLGFKNCALDGLLNKAHSLISESRNEQKQLIARKKLLHKQHNQLVGEHPELRDIERQLAEIRIKLESPDHHLSQILEVLHNPEHYIKMETQSMTLNNLGIKLANDRAEKGFKINYAEVEIEQSLKRTIMIVNCSAREVSSYNVH
ncbi:hypothetical protein [Kaarinaea lacus]